MQELLDKAKESISAFRAAQTRANFDGMNLAIEMLVKEIGWAVEDGKTVRFVNGAGEIRAIGTVGTLYNSTWLSYSRNRKARLCMEGSNIAAWKAVESKEEPEG